MCGFQVGDEVVAVGAPDGLAPSDFYEETTMTRGQVYVVSAIYRAAKWLGLVIDGHPSSHSSMSWDSRCFRKVERKNDSLSIEAFLTIKPGFEEPKRTPAKKRERV